MQTQDEFIGDRLEDGKAMARRLMGKIVEDEASDDLTVVFFALCTVICAVGSQSGRELESVNRSIRMIWELMDKT